MTRHLDGIPAEHFNPYCPHTRDAQAHAFDAQARGHVRPLSIAALTVADAGVTHATVHLMHHARVVAALLQLTALVGEDAALGVPLVVSACSSERNLAPELVLLARHDIPIHGYPNPDDALTLVAVYPHAHLAIATATVDRRAVNANRS